HLLASILSTLHALASLEHASTCCLAHHAELRSAWLARHGVTPRALASRGRIAPPAPPRPPGRLPALTTSVLSQLRGVQLFRPRPAPPQPPQTPAPRISPPAVPLVLCQSPLRGPALG